MDFQQHVQLLKVRLLGISRLSQRELDYSIKGYELGRLEFCRHACSAEHEIGEHYCQIKYLCRQLITAKVTAPSDFRFALAALRINRALYKTYGAAAQIAQDTILFFESNPMTQSAALNRFGELVNCLVTLCVVALFEKEASHAETVLQSQGIWRRCELIFDHLPQGVSRQMEAQDFYVLKITHSLGVVAKQAHEMADAILFWLKEREGALAFEADGHDALDFLFGGSRTRVESKYQSGNQL
jgi:hypothetical protein